MQPTYALALFTALCLAGVAHSATATPETAPLAKTTRETNLTKVKALDAEHLRECGSQTNFLVRPGLVADWSNRTVRVSAESIALRKGDPVEFLLITTGSGKNYETHAVSFASAADIHQALEFIGLRPGQCTDSSALRFWPKGDRVRITFRVSGKDIPAEQLTLDTRTGKTLPETGFVFTGSERVAALAPATGTVYSADAFSPGSISSLYNDPSTVLDVPRKASQSEVYTYQVPNPDQPLPANALIEVVLEPYFRDTEPHRFDYSLVVAPGKANEAIYSLVDAAGQTINTNRTLDGLLATLGRITAPDRDVFVVFRPDDALPLKPMPALAQVLGSLDTERGIRLEAPPAGHPYFRAFIPNQAHRRREDRPAAAAELYLATTSQGTTTGALVFVETTWKADNSPATFSETRLPVPTPDSLAAALSSKDDAPAVMLIFAPDTLTYGTLRAFAAPLLKRHMILYVFQR